jgi:hypothetical protein
MLVCTEWCAVVRGLPNEWNKIFKEYQDKLYYDEDLYDAKRYTRLIVQRELDVLQNDYLALGIPQIETCISDLDGEEMSVVTMHNFPLEIRAFMCAYLRTPHMQVHLYRPQIMTIIYEAQVKFLREKFTKSDASGVVLLSPLCYSEYMNYKKSYHNVLCYVNVIDKALEEEYPHDSERYIVLELQKSQDLQKLIIPYYENNSDLPRQCQGLANAFDILVQNHYLTF